VAATHPALSNVAPITALVFCGAVYSRDWRWWLLPFAALILSDLWLNHNSEVNSGYTMSVPEILVRAASIGIALMIGRIVASRRNALTILAGTLWSSLLFYLSTNTLAWAGDAFYAGTFQGLWQALTVGHPQYPPTLWFFRNTLIGDLLFTALFVFVRTCVTVRQTVSAAKTLP